MMVITFKYCHIVLNCVAVVEVSSLSSCHDDGHLSDSVAIFSSPSASSSSLSLVCTSFLSLTSNVNSL